MTQTRTSVAARRELITLVIMVALIMPLGMIVAGYDSSTSALNTSVPLASSPGALQLRLSRASEALFPIEKWNVVTPGSVRCSPTTADLNADGKLEVIVATYSGYVYCLNSTTGRNIWTSYVGNMIDSALAVVDIVGSSKLEVIVGALNGSVSCLNGSTGVRVWRYTSFGSVYNSPVVDDLDGNGKKEVVFVTYGSVYCLNSTGSRMWQFSMGVSQCSSPVLTDLFKNGKREVVVGSYDNTTYCLNGTTGSKVWSYKTGGSIQSSPVSADTNADARLEIVVGSNDKCVYCLNGTTGNKLWSSGTHGMVSYSPIVADLFGNGKAEVVAMGQGDAWVYCINGTSGQTLWSRSMNGGISSSPIVVDLFKDGKAEVAVESSNAFIFCINGTSGQTLWSCPTTHSPAPPIVVDILGNGNKELIVGGYYANVYCLNGTNGNRVWSYGTSSYYYYFSPRCVADVDGDGKTEIIVGSTANRVYCLDAAFMPCCRMTLLVQDSNGQSISGASVSSATAPQNQAQLVGYTNSTGGVTFDPILLGNYYLAISKSGYSGQSISLGLSTPGQNYVQYISLATNTPPTGGGGGGGGSGSSASSAILPLLGILGFVILLAFLAVVRIGEQDERPLSSPWGREDNNEVSQETRPSGVDQGLAPTSAGTCPICRVKLVAGASYCHNCGANIQSRRQPSPVSRPEPSPVSIRMPSPAARAEICTVCKLKISGGGDIVRCPYCGYKAHKAHMLEWLHVKDYCPVCQRHLDENQLLPVSPSEQERGRKYSGEDAKPKSRTQRKTKAIRDSGRSRAGLDSE